MLNIINKECFSVWKITECDCVLFSGAVFVRNPLNRELVATFEIIVSVHDNASDIIDKSVSVPNGKAVLQNGKPKIFPYILSLKITSLIYSPLLYLCS